MDDVLKALDIMWKGVLAIFIVIALVIVVTKVVNAICVKMDKIREEKKQKKLSDENQD